MDHALDLETLIDLRPRAETVLAFVAVLPAVGPVLKGATSLIIAGATMLASTAVYLVAPGCISMVSTTELEMRQVDKRLQLHGLRYAPPDTRSGLAAVYGHDPLPKDAWGRPFYYMSPGPDGAQYDVVSFGADGLPGGARSDADLYLSEMNR